jgi:hypothetical protein
VMKRPRGEGPCWLVMNESGLEVKGRDDVTWDGQLKRRKGQEVDVSVIE